MKRTLQSQNLQFKY